MINDNKCVLCNSHDISVESEIIDDLFDGISFTYIELYTKCNDCGFEFVSSEQSRENLKRRFS